MPRYSKAITELSLDAKATASTIGANLRLAIKSREDLQGFAQRIGVNRATLGKLLNGDPSIQVGVLLAALDSLGLLDHLEGVAAPEKDQLGQSIRLGSVQSPKVDLSGDF